jgi:hypothetical protein
MEGSTVSVESIGHSEVELVQYGASPLRLCPRADCLSLDSSGFER